MEIQSSCYGLAAFDISIPTCNRIVSFAKERLPSLHFLSATLRVHILPCSLKLFASKHDHAVSFVSIFNSDSVGVLPPLIIRTIRTISFVHPCNNYNNLRPESFFQRLCFTPFPPPSTVKSGSRSNGKKTKAKLSKTSFVLGSRPRVSFEKLKTKKR